MKQRIIQILTIVMTVALLNGINVYASVNKPVSEASELTKLPVWHETEYGGISISVSAEDFHASGFDYGDSVIIVFSNGYTLEDLPYYNGFYVQPQCLLLWGKDGLDYVKACLNYGDDLWEIAKMKDTDTADITLCEKGKYLSVQETNNLVYSDNRSDYASDVIFANFREITTGKLREGILYRSASPCDNVHNRAPYTDRLIQGAGVAFVLDLADNEEKVAGYLSAEDYDSPYFRDLYETGRTALLSLNMNYSSDEFRSTLIEGLRSMKDYPGPYLVHCTEGKDRAGYVCMLLEALTGSTYDEIVDDYMLTYQNYYGIDKDAEEDHDKYEAILNLNIIPMLSYLVGDEQADPRSADLEESARRYLADGGMSDDEILELLNRLQ